MKGGNLRDEVRDAIRVLSEAGLSPEAVAMLEVARERLERPGAGGVRQAAVVLAQIVVDR